MLLLLVFCHENGILPPPPLSREGGGKTPFFLAIQTEARLKRRIQRCRRSDHVTQPNILIVASRCQSPKISGPLLPS